MCRLLGWTGTTPRSAAEAIGPDAFNAFVELGRLHRDGWGLAWWPTSPPTGSEGPTCPAADEPTAPAFVHSTTAATEGPELRRLGAAVTTDAGIAHLRWATPSMPVVTANCHPFVRADLAMAHNGGLHPIDRLNEILPPEWEARMDGNTDSERYMLSVVAAAEEGRSVADALADVLPALWSGWTPSSLNAIWLTPNELIAVCVYDPDFASPELPEPADRYYRLSRRQDEHGVVVASSGFDQAATDGWSPLDNMTMLIAPRSGAPARIRNLDVPEARPSREVTASSTSKMTPAP